MAYKRFFRGTGKSKRYGVVWDSGVLRIFYGTRHLYLKVR